MNLQEFLANPAKAIFGDKQSESAAQLADLTAKLADAQAEAAQHLADLTRIKASLVSLNDAHAAEIAGLKLELETAKVITVSEAAKSANLKAVEIVAASGINAVKDEPSKPLTLSRAEFDKLTLKEQNAFFKEHGKIVN